MKRLLCLVAASALLAACDDGGIRCNADESFEDGQCIKDFKVRLNSVGYLPGRAKWATFPGSSGDFQVLGADGSMALSGTARGPQIDADTRENLWEADFSSLSTPGTFHIVAGGSRSPDFKVAADLYDGVLNTLMLGMYGQRCGTNATFSYGADTFSHDECHMEDAHLDFFPEGSSAIKLATRGWHDAGDYGKYTNNGSFSVAMMLYAWQRHQPALEGLSLPIPEHGGPLPDFLAECKWQMDWLSSMQFDDGSVSDRITTPSFDQLDVTPSASTTPRRFAPVSTVAVADFAATMALAARVYQTYDADIAQSYSDAASKAYAFLIANPTPITFSLTGNFTGGYQSDDKDDRLWAAAEMWELTGDASALSDFEQIAKSGSKFATVNPSFDWADLTTLGLTTYALSQRDGRDATLVTEIQQSFISTADTMAKNAIDVLTQGNDYGRALFGTYFWGINGAIARTAITLDVANILAPNPRYLDTTSLQLDHLLGRNYYGRSFVTGLGFFPPQSPHHRPSISDNVNAPWPGLLVGGSHNEQDATQKATSWKDDSGEAPTNEIAINWNAPMIYAAAVIAR
ncbi:MAG TPA: glycoside hydrolase family 9 protein [Polyangiaceae bacterium]|jgi:endoglucanase